MYFSPVFVTPIIVECRLAVIIGYTCIKKKKIANVDQFPRFMILLVISSHVRPLTAFCLPSLVRKWCYRSSLIVRRN